VLSIRARRAARRANASPQATSRSRPVAAPRLHPANVPCVLPPVCPIAGVPQGAQSARGWGALGCADGAENPSKQ